MTCDLSASTIMISSRDGTEVEAYAAHPTDVVSTGGVVVIHHMPGFDEQTKEIVRRFAAEGFNAICPNLYFREAPGADPDDAAAAARALGGVPDERLVDDVAGAAEHLRALHNANGSVGTIGYCSGGRQSVLAACSLDLQAAIDCYGAFVLADLPDGFPLAISPLRDKLGDLSCPLLGLFGADDSYPAPSEVAELEELLVSLGKNVEFHTYDGAGHAFFATNRTSYRPEAANDGWGKILAFVRTHLGGQRVHL